MTDTATSATDLGALPAHPLSQVTAEEFLAGRQANHSPQR